MDHRRISTSTWKSVAGLTLWGAALWSVLSLHDAQFFREHSICGPWGCGPTIPALIAAHGFWLVLLLPAAVWVARKLDRRRAVALGWTCVVLGGLGASAVSLIELRNQPEPARLELRSYTTQRVLFALATTVEVPLFPGALAGLVLLRFSRRPQRERLSDDPDHHCDDSRCEGTDTNPEIQARIEVGKPLPGLTVDTSEAASIVVSELAGPAGLLLYFMRSTGCSICRGHVRALAGMADVFQAFGVEVIIVHPDRRTRSRPGPFVEAMGRESRAYEAVGLSSGRLGRLRGSGTILVDGQGIVRLARLAGWPFNAFSEAELRLALEGLPSSRETESLGSVH